MYILVLSVYFIVFLFILYKYLHIALPLIDGKFKENKYLTRQLSQGIRILLSVQSFFNFLTAVLLAKNTS